MYKLSNCQLKQKTVLFKKIFAAFIQHILEGTNDCARDQSSLKLAKTVSLCLLRHQSETAIFKTRHCHLIYIKVIMIITCTNVICKSNYTIFILEIAQTKDISFCNIKDVNANLCVQPRRDDWNCDQTQIIELRQKYAKRFRYRSRISACLIGVYVCVCARHSSVSSWNLRLRSLSIGLNCAPLQNFISFWLLAQTHTHTQLCKHFNFWGICQWYAWSYCQRFIFIF